MATINDVCRAAGVSKATVSRVINGTGQVKQSTREKVEAVMAQLNYRPSSLAQALASQSANSIGLVISDFTGGYFGSLLKQASVSAEQMGKQLLFADGHNNAEDELSAVHSLVEKKCDIIILYSRKLSCEQIVALSRSITIPIVTVGRLVPQEAGFSISFDQANAVKKAGGHLIELGHKQLSYIGPKPSTPTATLRLQGFHQLVEQYAHQGVTGKVCLSPFGFMESYQATKAYLESGDCFGTAIVAAADDIAIGCIKALREQGIKVPQDISVVSIDNDPCSPFVEPPLTTIDIPIKSITERAMEVAKQLIEKGIIPKPEVYSGDLIIRESAIKHLP
ncbi:LacI family transcriptional regulator [Vibrio panuliri]|uniref:LacI family transcriptional regulator n=1 Tax=Vibrio panuliri TaxID=1381081 RepID=A0A1Q9HIU1_9VIBR|nr:LacI family DNA-binding transcriptional regulator [Vibrio panuliri]OLQ90216.1 LacI family transcriptional regulator [Vibrio panuliri]